MSFWKVDPYYEWDDETRERALAVFDMLRSLPDTTVSTTTRRPAAITHGRIIVAAHGDGLAFRLDGVEGAPAKGLAVRGMTAVGADRWQEWEDYARRAHEQAVRHA